MIKFLIRTGITVIVLYLTIVTLVYFLQRSLLYFPSHASISTGLAPWTDGKQTIGRCHEVPNPAAIWLMLHGNGGQAEHRDYVLPCLPPTDSLYVVEYPGYGHRPGSPSRESLDKSAEEAYQLLRARNPGKPVCVLGESLGSGPACILANEKIPPDKIVLVVPFDTLASVAAGHYPFLPVRLLLRDNWDNIAALRNYAGPIEIYGAPGDEIIPFTHAKALAAAFPTARFNEIPGGHNDWSSAGKVKLSP